MSAASVLSMLSSSSSSTEGASWHEQIATIQAILKSDDMGEIQRRLHVMMQRHSSLGPPVPTSSFPLPPEDCACKHCRRPYRSTRNPYGGGSGKPKSPFLTQSRPGSALCQTCRNVKNWAYPSWEMDTLAAKCQEDEFHVKYLLIVFVYEDKAVNSKCPLAKSIEDLPASLGPVTVSVTSSVKIKGQLMLGNVWPVDVYKKHEGQDPPKHLVKTFTHNNRAVRGILREPSHGQPIGVIQLLEETAAGVNKVSEVVDSSTAPRGRKQADEAYDMISKRAGVSVDINGKQAGDDPEALGLTLRSSSGSKKQDVEMASLLDSIWSSPLDGLVAASPMKRSTGTTRSSQGDSGKKPRGGSAGAAQRSHQLGLSEQVVLKAKLLTQDLENDETVMQQGTKKLENVLSSLAARMSDKVCYDDFSIFYGRIFGARLYFL